jgi:mannose-1-phosphate guanylyltransferase
MDVVVMAAGRGTRLLPLTVTRPKPMIPFFNIPLVDYLFHELTRIKVDRVFMLVDYLQESLMKHCGDGSKYGLQIGYYTNNEPFGTAGACKKVVGEIDDHFLVLSADVVTNIDLRAFIDFHKAKGGPVTIALSQVDNPSQYGVALLDGDKRIERFLEKPKPGEAFSNKINAGMYMLDPAVFKHVPAGCAFDYSRDLFPKLLKDGERLYGFEFGEYWNDLGLPSTYLAASEDALKGRLRVHTVHPRGTHFSGGERALISGRNCIIHGSLHVDGFAVMGNNVEIGKNVDISRSIIWDGTKIGDNVKLRETIVGEGCVIGPNTILETGCVAGDHCMVGEDSKIGMNIKLWYGSRLGPGTIMIPDQ